MAVDGLVDGGVLTFNGIRCGGSRDGCCGSPNNSDLDLIDHQKDETELLHFVRRRETQRFSEEVGLVVLTRGIVRVEI